MLKLKAETGVDTTPWQEVIIYSAKTMSCAREEKI
jgi:hypothetical protein